MRRLVNRAGRLAQLLRPRPAPSLRVAAWRGVRLALVLWAAYAAGVATGHAAELLAQLLL